MVLPGNGELGFVSAHYCRLEAARLAEAEAWLRYYERFWNRSLDTLEALLRAEDERAREEKRK